MKNLFRWEMKHALSSKAFPGIGLALTAITVLLLLAPLCEDKYTGFDIFLQGCNNFNSLLLFFIGIYSGIHVTGAFEERRLQAAVMAGNSRFSILLSKLISFSLSVAMFCIAAVTASAVLAFSVKGMNGFENCFFRDVIARTVAYTLVEVSFASICFFLSMLAKNLGSAIAVNFVALLGANSLAQELITKEWAVGFMKFTPAGQTFMLLADAGTENLIVSAVASLLGLALTIAVSYIKFRKEELK